MIKNMYVFQHNEFEWCIKMIEAYTMDGALKKLQQRLENCINNKETLDDYNFAYLL